MSSPPIAEEFDTQRQAVAAIPLFKSLAPEEIASLAGLLKETTFQDGETIFHENEPGDAMYIVRRGRVRIWTRDADTNEVTLALLEAGAFFGELAVLDGGERSATATCTIESELYRLSQKDFHSFMLAHPAVAVDMIRHIGLRLRQTNQIVSERITRNVNDEMEERMTFGERIADRVATFGGSWTFIFIFGGVLVAWMALNTYIAWARTGNPADPNGAFDPFPFIALNLLLSSLAAFQAPIIMMSQNRSATKDRLAAENDFKVNLKSEQMLQDLTRSMRRLQNDQMEELRALVRQRSSDESIHTQVAGTSESANTRG
ncbi:MAG: DUF1003 domain-containing protein [Pyrinomonadaceae bacterium]|nr:DUF1003 domain-containing protein [Pyrinomonadaceae bacterium]